MLLVPQVDRDLPKYSTVRTRAWTKPVLRPAYGARLHEDMLKTPRTVETSLEINFDFLNGS